LSDPKKFGRLRQYYKEAIPVNFIVCCRLAGLDTHMVAFPKSGEAETPAQLKSMEVNMNIKVSNGELVDKVSILSIKLEKIKTEAKLKNIRHEFDLLYACMESIGINVDDSDYKDLMAVNECLWDIEDRIRIKESRQEFDDDFIQLARQVYFENDKRSEIKRRINLGTGSDLIEEKEYTDYK
jgi:uncharacterized protein DUF6165